MKNSAIIGTFEGQCADANITNLNGLDITRAVWENVFDSDEYKRGIELGHFIGFLGHPEDPGCQDFEHACIVMTDGYIDTDGKVYGKFNLVDTPVGRIVKSFIDAGVTFGISVRGAGDIVDNSVDPDTFVFRGFDLVAFPAYPDAIPEYTPIAASSDANQQAKYKKVCAAVHNNIGSIDSVTTLEAMQQCVASQSVPYKEIETRKSTVVSNTSISAKKLDAMTNMYLMASEDVKKAKRAANEANRSANRRINRIKQIMSAQLIKLQAQVDSEKKSHAQDSARLKATIASSRNARVELSDKVKELEGDNVKLRSEIRAAKSECNKLSSKIEASQIKHRELARKNLIYNQKLDAAQDEVEQHQANVSEMQAKMRETVTASKDMQSRLSNLDNENQRLRAEVASLRSNLSTYQSAYAELYAAATGGDSAVSITASTSIDELNRKITGTLKVEEPLTEDAYIGVGVEDDDLTTL